MTIATIIIGIIPSYQDIGSYAPFILIIMRLLQGLCISGEGAGTAIFILEHYQKYSLSAFYLKIHKVYAIILLFSYGFFNLFLSFTPYTS